MGYLLLLLASLAICAAAVPSPLTLKSDVKFVFQQNLNWTENTEHQGAILLTAPMANELAAASRSELGETLLTPNSAYFYSDFAYSFDYLVYSGQEASTQLYWISSADGACRAIGYGAAVTEVTCSETLPVLCSQSATLYEPTDGSAPVPYEIQVESQGFAFTGTRNSNSFRFLGIPYANQPERWTYSTQYTGSPDINATAFQSPCLQAGLGSEDCLFLNIWTDYLPEYTPAESVLKPVFFWIHGGAFTSGAGSDYDGGPMVSRGDVVVVSINYRLSTLGFLALNDETTNGNYGLADQITALDWVRQYITAFGGDPERITIAGQSAGAGSVRALYASPMALGKFQAGIPQSNLDGMLYAATYSNYYTISQEMQVAGYPILEATGCNSTNSTADLACLRNYSGTALVNMANVARYVVVDGTYIITNQLEFNGTGPINYAHLMMGIMSDDGNSFISYLNTSNLSYAVTEEITYNKAETNMIIVSGLFPAPNTGNSTLDVFNVTARLSTDVQFRCLDQATVVAAAKHNVLPSIWYYQFNRGYDGYDPNNVCYAPIAPGYPNGDPNLPHFNCHSGELAYTFGTIGEAGSPFRDVNDLYFSQQIVDQWTSFVRTYNPNPATAYLAARGYSQTAESLAAYGPWEQVTSANATVRLLSVPQSQVSLLETPQCDYFNYPASYYN